MPTPSIHLPVCSQHCSTQHTESTDCIHTPLLARVTAVTRLGPLACSISGHSLARSCTVQADKEHPSIIHEECGLSRRRSEHQGWKDPLLGVLSYKINIDGSAAKYSSVCVSSLLSVYTPDVSQINIDQCSSDQITNSTPAILGTCRKFLLCTPPRLECQAFRRLPHPGQRPSFLATHAPSLARNML